MKELVETLDAIIILQGSITKLSNMVKTIENKLQKENKFNFEFEYHADNIEGVFISWKRQENTKKRRCRLFLKVTEKDFERPFAELPVEMRLQYVKYLAPFMIAFREFLQTKIEEVQKVVEELEEDWDGI